MLLSARILFFRNHLCFDIARMTLSYQLDIARKTVDTLDTLFIFLYSEDSVF